MPERPGFDLEDLLAADEVAIRDDGFSDAVMRRVERQTYVRRVAIYGAGMMGFGLAAGGVSRLGEMFPSLSNWFAGLATMADGASLSRAEDLLASGNASTLALIVAGLGAAFFLLSTTLQER